MVENLNEYWPNLLITFNFTCNEKTLKEIVVVLTDKLETIVDGKSVIKSKQELRTDDGDVNTSFNLYTYMVEGDLLLDQPLMR